MEPLNLLGLRFFLAFVILFSLFLRKVLRTIKNDPKIIGSSLLLVGLVSSFIRAR